MSADGAQPILKVAVLWGLVGCTGIVAADEAEIPDMEFLEYLGSWEESDEDWLLLADDADEQADADGEETDPAPQGEKLAELEDES